MNITNVKISVCIPVYGVEKYIERCARSLFEQTMTDGIEFIFVNDCTKDKSIEILEQVLSEYPQRKDQVKIIHHEKNGGLVAARNTGLKHATGDYIIHCDSDDWVDLNMYETMYNKAIETDADMVYCDFYESSENKDCLVTHAGTCNAEKLIKEMFYGITHSALWNKMFKREIALRSDLYCPDHICMCEDLLRTVQMLLHCCTISYIAKPGYHYRCNYSSISKSIMTADRLKNCIEIYDYFLAVLPAKFNVEKQLLLCRKLTTMMYIPEKMSTREYRKLFNEINYENLQSFYPFIARLDRVFLHIAYFNYPFTIFVNKITFYLRYNFHKINKLKKINKNSI